MRRLICRLRNRHWVPGVDVPGWTWDGFPICRMCKAELR